MIVAGVDPGSHGAIAILDDAGQIITIHQMPAVQIAGRNRPSPQLIAQLLKSAAIDRAFIEKVGPFQGSSAMSAFSFGWNAGIVEGVLAGLGIPLTLFAPTRWKNALGLDSDKGRSRQKAMQLWPDKASEFAKASDHDRAEAALIAWYGLRMR